MRTPPTARSNKEPRAPRIIKRYANRKLYDTEESAYVTLEEIADAIRMGEEVRIIDNKTQEDLTSVTLTQIIFEQEKKSSLMPIGMLIDLIRNSGAQLSGYLQSGVGQVTTRAGEFREKIYSKGRPQDALLQGPSQSDLTQHLPSAPKVKAAANTSAKENASQLQGKTDQTKELLSQIQKSLDEWHRQLDSRVHQTVEQLSTLPTLANEMNALEKRIRELEARLEELDLE